MVYICSINGVPACANKKLLTDITRTEWGFRGYVVSDAGAIGNIITAHKYLPNTTMTAAACISAGCNLELGGAVFLSQIQALQQVLYLGHYLVLIELFWILLW